MIVFYESFIDWLPGEVTQKRNKKEKKQSFGKTDCSFGYQCAIGCVCSKHRWWPGTDWGKSENTEIFGPNSSRCRYFAVFVDKILSPGNFVIFAQESASCQILDSLMLRLESRLAKRDWKLFMQTLRLFCCKGRNSEISWMKTQLPNFCPHVH